MKVCLLAGASSIHTVRWANAIAGLGHNVSLITMHPSKLDQLDEKIKVYELKYKNKFGYYLNFLEVRSLLKKIQPDLLNVHYASGYGTLARLANFTPTLLSVWGSDVYLYPYKNKGNKKTLIKNLMSADQIASTSIAMSKQTKKFIEPSNPIEITPFGIDLEKVKALKNKPNDQIVIGTVKSLKSVYGIDILINATAKLFELLKKENSDLVNQIQLKIVGNGPEFDNLNQLAMKLNISHITEFVGAIPNEEVPKYLSEFDVYCAFSHSESFGVAILEASACQVPVIVSNVGGLPEVVLDGETGFVVNHLEIDEVTKKLLTLVTNPTIREDMGQKGRKFVKEHYEWKKNVLQMEKVYENVIEKHKKM